MKRACMFLSIIVFLAAFICLLTVTISWAQTVRHVATNGTDAGNCTGNPCATLSYAIFQAAPGNVIQIAAGTYHESIIIVNKSVTFRGAGSLETTIHADQSIAGGGIFRINQGMNVELSDMTIMKGVANEGSGITMGGGIYNAGGNLTINNVFFVENAAQQGGGGIYHEGGDLFMTNVSFVANVSFWFGGGLHIAGVDIGEVKLVDVVFTRNEGLWGGGLSLYDSSQKPVELHGVQFFQNRASHSGGGMDVLGSTPMLRNLTFIGNMASDGGGMSIMGPGSPRLANAIFMDNTVSRNGGALRLEANGANFFNITFYNNSANNSGGAVYNHRSSNNFYFNCIFWGNNADTDGNDILTRIGENSLSKLRYSLYSPGGVVGEFTELETITDNPLFVDASGGNLRLQENSPAINAGDPSTERDQFKKDLITGPQDMDGNRRFFHGTIDMGPYELGWTGGSRIYVNKTAAGNGIGTNWGNSYNELGYAFTTAELVGSGIDEIWVAAGEYTPEEIAHVPRSSSFSLRNGLGIYGGFNGTENFLFQRDPVANETILSGDINQTGDLSGNSLTIVFVNSTINNTAILDGFTITGGNADGDFYDNSRGGAIQIKGGSPILRRLVIKGNFAESAGGGVYIQNFGHSNSPQLSNIIIRNNSTRGHGGGMYVHNTSPDNQTVTPVLTNVSFLENEAIRGGGMYSNLSSPVLQDVEFIQNHASNGGGMFNQSSAPILQDVEFRLNTAQNGAGMLNEESEPVLENVSFTGNIADNGGAIFNAKSSPQQFQFLTFDGNKANATGGAIINDNGSSPKISNAVFRNNEAGWGGGMMNWRNSSPTLVNTVFIANKATVQYGGGIYNTTSSSPSLYNVTFHTNTAESQGGAMASIQNSHPEATNTIFWGNTAKTSGNEIFNDGNSTATLNFSLYKNGGGDVVAGGGFTANHSTTQDPGFENPPDDLLLATGSPAINTGDPETDPELFPKVNNDQPIDLAGNNRFQGGIIDMGAFETEIMPCPADEQGRLFVRKGFTGDGSGWNDALGELRDALKLIKTGSCLPDSDVSQVWVASGTFTPTSDPANRTASFDLVNGVGIYGGFSGTETSMGQRNLDLNVTTLSGDINDSGNFTGNSYHVVNGSNTNSNALLNGFTITGGNANGTFPNNSGGGIFLTQASPLLANLVITGNRASGVGGGVRNLNGGEPVLVNITFSENTANQAGGMYNADSSPLLFNVVFDGNAALIGDGGGMYNIGNSTASFGNVTFTGNSASNCGGAMFNDESTNTGSSHELYNVVFNNNSAGFCGGAIHNVESNPILVNSVITLNTANDGGGIYNELNSSPLLINSIIWGNEAINEIGHEIYNHSDSFVELRYSLYKNEPDEIVPGGGFTANNSLTVSPLFNDPSNGDFTLQPGSPAIDAGDPNTEDTGFPRNEQHEPIDRAGNPRFQGDAIDIGAFETGGAGGDEEVWITGGPGWRMMGVPFSGITAADLGMLNLVQGVSGMPYSGASPNLLIYDNTSATFLPAFSNSNDVLDPGTGMIWYMYDNDLVPESKHLPILLDLEGTEPNEQVVLLNSGVPGWHLVANPYAATIDLTQLHDGSAALNIAGQVWDPNAESYISTTSVEMDNKLSMWQGMFIELTEPTDVIIGPEAKTSGGVFLRQHQPMAGQVEFFLESKNANGDMITGDQAAILYFHEKATTNWDGFDMGKLTPLAQQYATFAFVYERNGMPIPKAQHSLPYDFKGLQEIPLNISLHNAPGNLTLSWPVTLNLPPGVEIWLTDQQTGLRYDLTRPGTFSFNMEVQRNKEESIPSDITDLNHLQPNPKSQILSEGFNRFIISISTFDTQIDPRAELPSEFRLAQNYPNPFNPSTIIRYEIPAIVNKPILLEVFDLTGRNVAVLVNERQSAGRYEVPFDATNLSSGIYLYRLQAGEYIKTRKMILVK